MKNNAGYKQGKSKLEKLLKDVNQLDLENFDMVYENDKEFRKECEGIDNYGYIKDFVVAFSKEIERQFSPFGCSDGVIKSSKKRSKRIYKYMGGF